MSTRIELIGQGYTSGSTPDGSIKIERPFPGILNGQISESEWTSFCDRVDQTLLPIADAKRQSRKMKLIYFLLSVILVGVFAIIFFASERRGGYYSSYIFYILPAVYIPLFIMNACFMIRLRKKAGETLTQLKQVCEDESNRRSNVSFHVRVSLTKGMLNKCFYLFIS